METTIPASPQRKQPMEIIGCLEMELEDHHDELDYCDDEDSLLANSSSSPKTHNNGVGVGVGSSSSSSSPMVELAQGLVTYLKLWIQLYPRVAMGIGSLLLLLVAVTWNPFRTRSGSDASHRDMTRNHVERDYTKLATDYDLRKAQIHHWCLFGGNDNCYCEDPTQGTSREEIKGWSESHTRNKHHIADSSVVQRDGILDVVFVGGEIFQAWGEGKFLGRSFDEGTQIATHFNETFRSPRSELQGLSLGIYTDRTTNLLWRLRHGEMPTNLHAKIWWILIGADDLALAMCSEDVVILGILRIAEEIAYHHPQSKVVIQGLLPRSNHKDGSLHITDDKRGSSFRHNSKEEPFDKTNIWKFRTDQLDQAKMDPGHSTTSSALQQAAAQAKQPYFDYYIWPSILEINKELAGFCNQSHYDQFEYYDADDLFVEQVGGQGGGSNNNDEKRIIRDLMPNSIMLSLEGHKVLMNAIKNQLKELLKESTGFD